MTRQSRFLISMALSGLGWAFVSEPVRSQPPWHASGWAHRAVIRVADETRDDGNTAKVRIFHNGLADIAGTDFRIFDDAGKRIPYQLTYHAPKRQSLISFKADDDGRTYFIYFGNENAKADPYAVDAKTAPGSGRPEPADKGGRWIPDSGLTLTTLRRPTDQPNPKNVKQLRKLIENSQESDGAAYRQKISDGFNPFGNSDHYISIYRGWIRLPRSGKWSFCTASNEASFSFIDGKKLVHWPGRHTAERGRRGQQNATVKLDKGLHYIEYYQEEVLLQQMAFLGVRRPTAKGEAGGGRFRAIPPDWFPMPHEATVQRYQSRVQTDSNNKSIRPTVMIRPELIDSVWPEQREVGQYTRYRFHALPGDAANTDGWELSWQLGDGISAEGANPEHVYLSTGEYQITLQATSPKGRTFTRTWPLTVFPIEHLEGPYKAGQYDDYEPIVTKYDQSALAADQLAELGRFLFEADRPKQAHQLARQILKRDDVTSNVAITARLTLIGEAGLAWSAQRRGANAQGRANTDQVLRQLQAARNQVENRAERYRLDARLIRVNALAGERSDAIKQAAERFHKAFKGAKGKALSKSAREALRGVARAMGDVYLTARQTDSARKAYRRSEALAQPVIPDQVRAARVGAAPRRLQRLLDEGKIDQALAQVHRWYEQFPTTMAEGQLPLWIGKIQLAANRPAAALPPLKLAASLGQGTFFGPEARWHLAQAQKQLDKTKNYQQTLHELANTTAGGEYQRKAAKALKQPN